MLSSYFHVIRYGMVLLLGPVLPYENIQDSFIHRMPKTPCEIAKVALDHYHHNLPNKGKPRENNEWTVYAAIVATLRNSDDNDDENTAVVISSATGTKCTAVKSETSQWILHDSHAEVLARRGLVRVLWHEIVNRSTQHRTAKSTTPYRTLHLLETIPNSDKYQLRPGIKLHLYVSDSPCGDASIYPLKSDASTSAIETQPNNKTNNGGLQFTGAKVIVSDATQISVQDCGVQSCLDGSCVAREQVQLLGRLRSKSGRSNLKPERRSESMSCSDKIVRWSVLGLQGSALLHHLQEPIRLSSVIVSRDIRSDTSAQLDALQRAIPRRVIAVKDELSKKQEDGTVIRGVEDIPAPAVHVIDQVFGSGKASSEHARDTASRKRKRDEIGKKEKAKLSPTGVCLNWNIHDNDVELTVGARGIRQGKKPKND